VPKRRGQRGSWRAFRRQPRPIQYLIGFIGVLTLSLAVNWLYQVIRKPSELLFPVGGTLVKSVPETWRSYSPLFREYSTRVITPELLAALAQAEGAGNPVARTYWRWSWARRPFEVYRPASSSVGLYQMTDGTFSQAKNNCIRDHVVVQDGPWNDRHSCWFNRFYFRVIPSHAIELTAAYLDVHVAQTLAGHRIGNASRLQIQHLAAVIHLCGAGAGDQYVRRGFKFLKSQRCGDQNPRAYLSRVDELAGEFGRLGAADVRG